MPFKILPYLTLTLPTVPGPLPEMSTLCPATLSICCGPPTAEPPGVINCEICAADRGTICPAVDAIGELCTVEVVELLDGTPGVEVEVSAWGSIVDVTVVTVGWWCTSATTLIVGISSSRTG